MWLKRTERYFDDKILRLGSRQALRAGMKRRLMQEKERIEHNSLRKVTGQKQKSWEVTKEKGEIERAQVGW